MHPPDESLIGDENIINDFWWVPLFRTLRILSKYKRILLIIINEPSTSAVATVSRSMAGSPSTAVTPYWISFTYISMQRKKSLMIFLGQKKKHFIIS